MQIKKRHTVLYVKRTKYLTGVFSNVFVEVCVECDRYNKFQSLLAKSVKNMLLAIKQTQIDYVMAYIHYA